MIRNNLRDMRLDMLVIGAGANGLCIGYEAALAGLSVLVVDKSDIGAATSSASSRMIHGGLRYLETFELSLVRESLRERERLFRNAGHLVKSMPVLVPVYKESTRSLATIRAGLLAYDVLSYDRSTPRSRLHCAGTTMRCVPGLKTANLRGAVSYADGQVEHSERLWIAYAKAIRSAKGTVANYTEVVGMCTNGDRITSVALRDTLTDARFNVHPDYIINAAGPWSDIVLTRGLKPMRQLVGGVKGSHIILPQFPGAPATAIHFETETGKPLLVIPWRGAIMVASTDQRWIDADPGEAVPDDAEIELLLSQTNRMFPAAGLRRDDIIDAFSGIRPLPYAPDQDSTKVTRSHFGVDHPDYVNLTTVVGGKITTSRQLGEDMIALYMKKQGRFHRSVSARKALPGHIPAADCHAFASDLSACHNLPKTLAQRITNGFGSESEVIAKAIHALPAAMDFEDPLARYISVVSEFAHAEEWARCDDDVFERRLALDYSDLRRRRPVSAQWRKEYAHV